MRFPGQNILCPLYTLKRHEMFTFTWVNLNQNSDICMKGTIYNKRCPSNCCVQTLLRWHEMSQLYRNISCQLNQS